jgi:phosphonate transport system substrate-binding protein
MAALHGCGGSTGTGSDPAELVFVFQKQKDPERIEEHAAKAAKFLSDQLQIPVTRQVPLKYSMAVQALVSGKADVAYLDSLAFVLARRDGDVEMLAAEVRKDASGQARTDYDSIIVVARDSPLKTIDDLVRDAANLRFAFTSEISTSGYLMAVRRLVNEGLMQPGQDPKQAFKSVAYAGGYAQALQQVLDGRSDVCAVSYYTMEGERADVYLDKAQRDRLRILARTPGVPTHLICERRSLSAGFRQRIKSALMKLSKERPELLADVYGAKSLTQVDEQEHVAATVEALKYRGIPVEKFVK